MKNNAEIARRAKLIVMGVALAGIVGLLFFAHHARLNPKLGADFPILPTATASEGVGRYDLYSDLQCRFYIGYVDTAREMFGVGNAIAYRDNYGGMYSTEYSSNPNDTSCINLKKLRGAVEDTVEAVGEFFESFTWAVGQVVDWVGKAGEFGAKMTEGERDLETVGIFEGTSDIVKDIAEEMMTNPACGQILLEIQAAENLIATSGGDMGQAIGGTIAVSEAREQYSGCIKLYGTVLEPATAKPFPSITYPPLSDTDMFVGYTPPPQQSLPLVVGAVYLYRDADCVTFLEEVYIPGDDIDLELDDFEFRGAVSYKRANTLICESIAMTSPVIPRRQTDDD